MKKTLAIYILNSLQLDVLGYADERSVGVYYGNHVKLSLLNHAWSVLNAPPDL
jgi:hypothetical protein